MTTETLPLDGSDIEPGKLFSSARDRIVIDRGGFFCHGCLVSHPAVMQSPDSRYCQFAYNNLLQDLKELRAAGNRRKFAWEPKPQRQSANKKGVHVVEQPSLNMSTSNGEKNKVDIFPPTPPIRRGPKSHDLPDDKIRQLALAGFGSKAIATRLQSDGVKVSYKTIQRRLAQ